MKTIIDIRTELETLLENELGTYTFKNGKTAIASCVLPDAQLGWEYPANGTKAEGLEMVLIPNITVDSKVMLDGFKTVYKTQIKLKQWDKTKTTVNATKILIQEFSELIEIRPRILPSTELKIIETQVINIVNPVVCSFVVYN
jgi:hypothetical protein